MAFSFANDTSIFVPGGTPSYNYSYGASAFNTNYAYTSTESFIERFDFSNDSSQSTVTHSSNPDGDRENAGVTGNQSYLYRGGGGSPAKSTVDRLDYSNDTAALAPKGPLTVARGSFAGATGNADYGWWFGASAGNTGWTGSGSLLDRVDYSNDTATASPRGPLSPGVSMEQRCCCWK